MVELAEMSSLKLYWQEKYPQAFCWSFGDSPALADELAALVVAGKKRGTCSSLVSYPERATPCHARVISHCAQRHRRRRVRHTHAGAQADPF